MAPYGSWRSPFRAGEVAAGTLGFGGIQATAGALYWLEFRPEENGRGVIVQRGSSGAVKDVTPAGFDVRSRVHEYGGGAFAAWRDRIVFTNLPDQRLFLQEGGGPPRPLTPEPGLPSGLRYADMRFSPDGRSIVCVQEVHSTSGPALNRLVELPSDASGPPRPLAEGRDFYAYPRWRPDGRAIAWLEWDHPNMPWDATELWTAEVGLDGALSGRRRVAGGPSEAVFQPDWSPQGVLHYVSDKSGWWNLYRLAQGESFAMAGRSAEFGSPAWTFGQSHYAFLHDGRIVCLYFENGSGKLALIDRDSRFQPIEIPWTAFQRFLTADSDGRTVWIVGASPTCGYTLLEVDPSRRRAKEIRSSIRFPFDARYVSSPESLWFAAGGDEVHAYLYPAHNPAFQPPRAEKPPLLVNVHGGPTGQAFADLKPEYQYWTSRGFSILDVNYGGSTGFGRAYRQRLAGQWGIVDVRDCVHGARAMVGVGRADGRRLAIRGSSAGGYTTLRALTLTEDFRAGASRYGVADLERLARETHKFESHYLDGLVGPYPESAKIYRERSPLHHADRLTRPVILFQGLEDEVVPPSQSEAMVAALGARRVPHAYLAFPGESHGFRSATVRARCLEAELYFYLRVFGIEAAEPLEPVAIADL